MDKNPQVIRKSIERFGGEFREIDKKRNIFEISYKGKNFLICRKFGIGTDVLSHTAFTKFKDVTCELLSRYKIKMPKTIVVSRKDSFSKIKEKIKKISAPYIVKNLSGSNSKGIFSGIESEADLLKILERELPDYKRLMVQELVSGKEYRLLILGGKIIAALNMVPPHVIGDGKRRVEELLEEKRFRLKLEIKLEENIEYLLKTQGEALDNIPQEGKVVYTKSHSSIAEGGIMIDVTDKVHESFAEVCDQAAQAVRLELAGIDLICEDIEKDVNGQEYAVLEINGKPDLYIHYEPNEGEERDVVKNILDYIVENNLI